MTMIYSNPAREHDGSGALPDVSVFYVGPHRLDTVTDSYGTPLQNDAWYWQRQHGDDCQFDGEPVGPFASEAEAVADAQADAENLRADLSSRHVVQADGNEESSDTPAVRDSAVFHRDMLDDEYAANFALPWLHELPDGEIEVYESDDAACAAQRAYRSAHGLDPLTGEELPPCVLAMRCYCAGHARGNPASEPCDTSETAPNECSCRDCTAEAALGDQLCVRCYALGCSAYGTEACRVDMRGTGEVLTVRVTV